MCFVHREPSRCCDAVDVSWTKLTDLSTHEGKLLGASCSNSFVGVWVVDLARCEPFHSGKDVGPGGGGTRDAPDRRGEFDENRPPPTHSGRAEEAVAAAALAAKARVEDSARANMRLLACDARTHEVTWQLSYLSFTHTASPLHCALGEARTDTA